MLLNYIVGLGAEDRPHPYAFICLTLMGHSVQMNTVNAYIDFSIMTARFQIPAAANYIFLSHIETSLRVTYVMTKINSTSYLQLSCSHNTSILLWGTAGPNDLNGNEYTLY